MNFPLTTAGSLTHHVNFEQLSRMLSEKKITKPSSPKDSGFVILIPCFRGYISHPRIPRRLINTVDVLWKSADVVGAITPVIPSAISPELIPTIFT